MSLSLNTIKNSQTDKLWFFRYKKFDSYQYLLTNDIWKYVFFTSSDFVNFLEWNFDKLENKDQLIEDGFIKSDDYERKMIEGVAKKNHFVWEWATLHMIIVTLRCNHKCKYCHAAVAPMTATQYDMDLETAKKVVDTIFYSRSNNLTIEFQWWEALLNYEIVQFIVDYAYEKANELKKNLSFSLVSNLTLLTETKLKRLLDRNVDICTSLDGNEAIHNYNRAWYDGNSFNQVTYWMQRLDEEKQKRNMWRVGALLTATKETLWNYKEIIDAYIEQWLDSIFLRWLNPYGFAASDMKTLAYEKEEWIDFYEKSLDYILELNKKGTPFKETITSIYLMRIFNDFDPAFMDIRSPSWIAIGWVAYNYDGKIYASDESRMLWRMWIDDFLMTDMLDSPAETFKAMVKSQITKIAVQSSCLDGLPGYNEHVYKPYIWVDIIHNFKLTGSVYNPVMKDEKTAIQTAIVDIIFKKLQNPEYKKIMLTWINK